MLGVESMGKLRRVFLFLSLVFLIVGVLQCFRWVQWDSEISCFALLLINLLPFVMFGGFYLILRKWKKTMWLHAAAVVLCICALVVYGLVAVGLESLVRATAEVTNIKKYERILNEYWTEEHMGCRGMVSHFPRPIPKGAKNVAFSFQPSFMSAAHIQLRYSSDRKTIGALYKEFSQSKTKSFFGGNTNDHMNVEEGMPTTVFYTSRSGDNRFPDDYEIMIFDEVLKERPEGFYWNHRRSHGVAISRKRNEIVYWAECW